MKIKYKLREITLHIMIGIVGFLYWIMGMLLLAIGFLYISEWIWPEFGGSYNLGNGIYMMEWDGGGRVIVKGSYIRGRTCYGGSQLIPTYESGYDSAGNFAEYVIDAKYDNNWIIAKTGNYSNGENKYYIVDKSFDIEKTSEEDIVENYIFDFTDSLSFANVCHQKGIKLKW